MFMYEVTVKGRNLKELKQAAKDFLSDLEGGNVSTGMVKNLDVKEEFTDEDLSTKHHVQEITPAPMSEQVALDTAGKELDSEGIPWDARIHSSGKTKYAKDGTWVIKRGVTDEEAEKIKSLYRTTPVVQAPVVVEEPKISEAPKAIAALTPAPIPTIQSGHTLETFKTNFPMILAGLITEGKVTQQYVNTLKEYFKVDQIWNISDEQKGEMFKSFVEWGFIQAVG